MRTSSRRGAAVLIAGLVAGFVTAFTPACTQPETPLRKAAVAGSFYPADPADLQSLVQRLLDEASVPAADTPPLALVSPHAGYPFSGPVAAEAYRRVAGRSYRAVIVVGASHRVPFKGVSVWARGRFQTPLGDIPVDSALAASLVDEKADIGFYPKPHEPEHSIETQLPFLQVALRPGFRIVPVLIGQPTAASFRALAERLSDMLNRHPDVLLVASTDLSHYHAYDRAVVMDRTAIAPVLDVDLEETRRVLQSGRAEMCGSWPVLVTLETLRRLGATHGLLYRYANSGDTAGDKARVVGYAAIGFFRSPLSDDEKAVLHRLAVETIRAVVSGNEPPEPEVDNTRLRSFHGVFVTINRRGTLRGCIGSIAPVRPLYRGVIENAKLAALHDPRFPPMRPAELADMEVEVSVLTPFKPVDRKAAPESIRIGRDGLYLVVGNRSGVFLPQVPVDEHWDVDTYLRMIGRKAGLTETAWRNPEARLFTFSADVIRPHHL